MRDKGSPTPGRSRSDVILVLTGLAAEARLLTRRPGVVAVAGGGDKARLEALIGHAIEEGGCRPSPYPNRSREGGNPGHRADQVRLRDLDSRLRGNDEEGIEPAPAISAKAKGLVSFGLAGGLAPGLAAGTLLIGREVVHGTETYDTHPVWAARLGAALPDSKRVRIAGVDRPVATVEAKRALFDETGAAAADMESHVVGRLAAKYRLPFAVIRAVADDADRALPRAALAGLRPDGTTNPWAVLRGSARHPSEIPALIGVALDTRRAIAALLRCVNAAGAGLGGLDLG